MDTKAKNWKEFEDLWLLARHAGWTYIQAAMDVGHELRQKQQGLSERTVEAQMTAVGIAKAMGHLCIQLDEHRGLLGKYRPMSIEEARVLIKAHGDSQ